MKKVNVEITGISPILMNNPANMLNKKDVSLTTEKRDPHKEAESKLYITKEGKLYVPATAIKGCLVNASSYKKFGKYSAKPLVAGGVSILPDEIILDNQKWELDYRTVVLQKKNRIPCARPKVMNWKLKFELMYNEKLIGSSDLLKTILEEAGERVGLLDFRPAKLGNFGMFKVSKWQDE